jgi:hypothetical protein
MKERTICFIATNEYSSGRHTENSGFPPAETATIRASEFTAANFMVYGLNFDSFCSALPMKAVI